MWHVKTLTGVLWRNSWGSPIAWPSQSITRDSSSVQAGELAWRWQESSYSESSSHSPRWSPDSWCHRPACRPAGWGSCWGRESRRACRETASGSLQAWCTFTWDNRAQIMIMWCPTSPHQRRWSPSPRPCRGPCRGPGPSGNRASQKGTPASLWWQVTKLY